MGVLSKGDHPTWGAAIKAFVLSPYFICAHLCHIIAMAVMISQHVDLQWYWLLLYSWATVPLSPWVSDAVKFLRGGLDDDKRSATSLGYLACSSFVAWVFAKSIYNSSTLGAKYGISGGLAYAGYYTSFASVAIAVFFMRTRHGYQSLPEAICMRYGPTAALVFGLCVLYRLFQEVWSNSLVVGSFYGGVHSNEWWAAVIVSTAIPAFYSFTGGMRSSLLTDTFQAVWKTVLLIVVLVVIGIQRTQLPGPPEFGTFNPAGTCSLPAPAPITFPGCATATGNPLNPATNYTSLLDPVKSSFTFTNASCSPYTAFNLSTCAYVGATVVAPKCSPTTEPACDQAGGSWTPRPMTSLTGGMDLLAVALLQGCLSYPFFDPVLTDRAFLAEPHTMLMAFMIGGAVAATFIILFSFVGIMGAMQTILAPQDVSVAIFASMRAGIPAAVASFFGTAVYSLLNLVFIISSCAVLDSTFASTAKLFGPEFFGLLQHGRPSPPSAAKPLHLIAGRVMIVVLAVCGTLPLMQSPTALDATTVSGTMVMGLGPPVWALTFIKGYRPLVFHLPFWSGLALGIVFQLSTDPCCKDNINVDSWGMGQGAYRMLLGFNVIGVAVCWGLGLIALVENWQSFNLLEEGGLLLLGAATRGWDAFAARLPTHWNVPKIGKAGALSYSSGKVPELDLQPSRSESSAAGGATHEPPGTTAYPSPSAPPLRPAAPTS